METIAVYWEPIIKTYGFEERPNLCLLRCCLEKASDLGRSLEPLGKELLRFALLQLRASQLLFQCAVDDTDRRLIQDNLTTLNQQSILSTVEIIAPVTMLTFHGPHYGDRYGIASAVFEAFEEHIQLLAAGFSAAAVALILKPEDVAAARSLLTSTFEIPDYER